MNEIFNSVKVGTVNGNSVYFRSVANFEAQFHSHDSTEEMFIVQSGTLYVDLESDSILLHAGDSFTVPVGVKHRTRAKALTTVIVVSKGLDA